MEQRNLLILLMIVSLKKELIDLILTIEGESEKTYSRKEIAKEVMSMVKSCNEIEELCN